MNVRHLIRAAAVALAAVPAVPAAATARPSVDALLPIVQKGPADVAEPDKVKLEDGRVTAASAQDAANVAVEQNRKRLRDGGPAAGAREIRFPSGIGVVATGAGSYRKTENPVAARQAKRHAYVVAYTKAKAELAGYLGGMTNEAKDLVRERVQAAALPKENLVNQERAAELDVKQAADMLLRGFVVYEVRDEEPRQTVYVSIAATPKTCAAVNRPTAGALETTDLRATLDQVIAEVDAGLVPPVGSRVITVRQPGGKAQLAFVGFGSAVVQEAAAGGVQAQQNLDAQKRATMYAKDALCGLLAGDRTAWEGRATERMATEFKQFESDVKGDPIVGTELDVKKLDQTRQAFVATTENDQKYQSARRGVIPPGTQSDSWPDDGNNWYYAIAVYVPGAEAGGDRIKALMNGGGDGGRLGGGAAGPGAGRGSSGFTDEKSPGPARSGEAVPPGKSPDKDL